MNTKIIDSILMECDGMTQRDKLDFVIHTLGHLGIPCDDKSEEQRYAIEQIILERK